VPDPKKLRADVRNALLAVTALGNLSLVACGGSDGQLGDKPNATTGVTAPAPAPVVDLRWRRPHPPAPAPAPAPAPSPAPAPPPAAYSATISWSVPQLNTDGTSLTDAAGYRVYYGTQPGNLSNTLLASGAFVSSVDVTGLAQGTYFFAVSTINASGVESAPSDPASRTFP